jgi:outer membrane protein OmpA-like peptidoglycan-associated protein
VRAERQAKQRAAQARKQAKQAQARAQKQAQQQSAARAQKRAQRQAAQNNVQQLQPLNYQENQLAQARRKAELVRIRAERRKRRLKRQRAQQAANAQQPAQSRSPKVVSRTRHRRADGALVIVERGRDGKLLNRRVIAAKDSRKQRAAMNAPAHAVSNSSRYNPDGTTTTMRRRSDGANVHIVRDQSGNVISRRVQKDVSRQYKRREAPRVINTWTRQLDDGTTKTVRRLADGGRVVVIRDNEGYVIDRRMFDSYGSEQRASHNGRRRRFRHHNRDINLFLPAPLPIPVEHYVVETQSASEEMIEEAFLAPPVYELERRYTIDEVKQDTGIRSSLRRVDLDTITFHTGDDQIPEFQISKLSRLASVISMLIEGDPDEVFLIEGHTDVVGSDDMNLFLSVRRANSVRQALVDTFYVPIKNLAAEGYGEDYLKIPTQGPEHRNHRVTVRRITPLISQAGIN